MRDPLCKCEDWPCCGCGEIELSDFDEEPTGEWLADDDDAPDEYGCDCPPCDFDDPEPPEPDFDQEFECRFELAQEDENFG